MGPERKETKGREVNESRVIDITLFSVAVMKYPRLGNW